MTINNVVEDNRRYIEDKHVKKMDVKYAENFSVGPQEIIHAAAGTCILISTKT